MRLAIIRQRYTPFGGAERFVERALDALARRGVEIALVTRRWPRDGDRARDADDRRPALSRPHDARRRIRARASARRSPRMPATLVQSHERIACCDIYRAGDGVHAVWVEERMRDASALDAAGAGARARITATCWRRSGGFTRARGCGR